MNLKFLRQQHGITQEVMAEKLGVSRPTYIQIERGEKEPTFSQMKTIAVLFQLHVGGSAENKAGVTSSPKDKNHILFDSGKFKEVLLYILEKVGAKPNIGETALYKLLYFIDLDFYEKYGRPLTGATYMKNYHGPTPRQFKPVTDEMIEAGELERVKSRYFQYDQKKYLPHRKANLECLNTQEKDHIDDVLARLSNKNGREMRTYSHDDFPWIATNDQKNIDYALVFQRSNPYAQRDHEMDFLDASAEDILKHLPPLTKEEYDYYMSLPDKK